MRTPTIDMNVFKERRRKIAREMEGAALIVAAHPEMVRNNSTHFPHRQDSNLYYLTGFEEPGSILIFRPGQTPETVLFCRKRDKERETWDGFRYGPELAEKYFAIEKAFPIEDFVKEAAKLLVPVDRVFYRMYKHEKVDILFQEVLLNLRSSQTRTGVGLLPVHDADILIGEQRLIKSDYELEQMRTANEISSRAHVAAMKFTRPGVTERQVQAVIEHQFMFNGCARPAYNSIVAAGNNATTLHYVFNDQVCKDKDLLLIDAGGEFNFYNADITRTFPINGKFTDEQARVYDGVLQIQKSIIEAIKPGLTFKEIHEMAASLLTELMLELGLLSGRKQDIIQGNIHRKYYPHGAGHWLGIDVHDAGLYFRKGEPRALEPNMVFTVEPGLYIPEDDDTAPKNYRGIGVRIEDNIRVTNSGYENFTASCPKEINDVEQIVGKA